MHSLLRVFARFCEQEQFIVESHLARAMSRFGVLDDGYDMGAPNVAGSGGLALPQADAHMNGGGDYHAMFYEAVHALNNTTIDNHVDIAQNLFMQVSTLASEAGDQFYAIMADAAVGDCHMRRGRLLTREKHYSLVISHYDSAIECQKRTIHRADELNIAAAENSSVSGANSEEFAHLGQAIHMSMTNVLNNVDWIRQSTARELDRHRRDLLEMNAARDMVKERIGVDNWKRNGSKSHFTEKREALQQTIRDIEDLITGIQQREPDIAIITNRVHQWNDQQQQQRGRRWMIVWDEMYAFLLDVRLYKKLIVLSQSIIHSTANI